MEEKIRIENVTKKFGSYAALDGISLLYDYFLKAVIRQFEKFTE